MPDDLKAMLADIRRAIENDEFQPNDWEADFLEKVGDLISFDVQLTDKQDEAFEKLWQKATNQDVGDDDPDEDDFV